MRSITQTAAGMVAAKPDASAPDRRPAAHTIRVGLGCVLGLLVFLGCASDHAPVDPAYAGGYASPTRGAQVAHPAGPGAAGWSRVSVDGADYAVRAPGGAVYSLSEYCRETKASVPSLARHLLIGTRVEEVISAGPIEHAGLVGHRQRFVAIAQDSGRRIAVDAVTLQQAACVYDLVVVSRADGDVGPDEQIFERWWQSFRPGPEAPADRTAQPLREPSSLVATDAPAPGAVRSRDGGDTA